MRESGAGRCCRKSISGVADEIFPRRWPVRRMPRWGPYRPTRKRPQGFVRGLRRLAAAEAAENRFLRDFSDCSIFDFFDSIGPLPPSTRATRRVRNRRKQTLETEPAVPTRARPRQSAIEIPRTYWTVVTPASCRRTSPPCLTSPSPRRCVYLLNSTRRASSATARCSNRQFEPYSRRVARDFNELPEKRQKR